MAKDPSKTEKATGKKLGKSREEGQVAKSQEVASAFILISGLAYLSFVGDRFFSMLGEFMRYFFQDSIFLEITPATLYSLLLLTRAFQYVG